MLYTPERLKLYKRAGEAFEAVSALGAALVSHEGSFLEATDDQFEAAVPTELAAAERACCTSWPCVVGRGLGLR